MSGDARRSKQTRAAANVRARIFVSQLLKLSNSLRQQRAGQKKGEEERAAPRAQIRTMTTATAAAAAAIVIVAAVAAAAAVAVPGGR